MSLPSDLIERINVWAKYPLLFASEALRVNDLDEWQLDFLSNLSIRNRVTVRAGRGVAKSFTLGVATLQKLLCYSPSKVLFTAPKADTVQDVIWSEIEMLRRRMPDILAEGVVIQSDSISIKGLERVNFAIIRTARPDNPDALRGAHSENMTVICEESSGISDSSFEVLEGTMTTPGAQMILVGNMSRTSGYFYDSHFNDKANLWHKIHVNAEDVARRGHAWYDPKFVEAKRAKYGIDSDQYKIEVKGDPPSAESGAVIPRYMIESAIYRDVEMFPGYLPVWGLDVGREHDRSALAKRCANVMLEPVKPLRIRDAVVLAERIKEEYEETERTRPNMLPAEILVDVIGMGGPVMDMLRRMGLPARGVNVAEAHSSRDRYRRKRDQIWFECRAWFERKDVRIPRDDELVGELASVRYVLTDDGKQKVESKDKIRSEGRQSPDLADAFVLTFAGGQARLPEFSTPERFTGSPQRGKAPSWLSL